ncbi:hypothetical protein D3C85_1476340 [compost metagenome]
MSTTHHRQIPLLIELADAFILARRDGGVVRRCGLELDVQAKEPAARHGQNQVGNTGLHALSFQLAGDSFDAVPAIGNVVHQLEHCRIAQLKLTHQRGLFLPFTVDRLGADGLVLEQPGFGGCHTDSPVNRSMTSKVVGHIRAP